MPLSLTAGAPTLVVQKSAYERAGISRADIDRALALTDQEFRVEDGIVAIGPVFDAAAFTALVEVFERSGLVYFDDFFEMSGNWPEWLGVLALARNAGAGRDGAG